jgi:hypothetical protein
LAYLAADELPAREPILLPVCHAVAIQLDGEESSTGAPVCQKNLAGCQLLLSQRPYSGTWSVPLLAKPGLQILDQGQEDDLLPCADAQIAVQADR